MLRFVIAIGLSLLCAAGFAAAKPLTPEEVWKPPNLSGITLSRDGKYMAATAPINGRMNLIIYDPVANKAEPLTGYQNFDVLGPRWVGNDRIVYSLGQFNSPAGPGQFDGGGLFVVSRDGKEQRRLSKTVRETRAEGSYVYRSLDFYRTIPGNDEEIIASGNMTSADSTDLYRLNLRNGRFTLLTQGRPAERTAGWILDSKLVPRIVSAGVKDKLTEVVYYRKDENSAWTEIFRFDADKGPVYVPLAFEADNQTLQIATNEGRDTMAIYRYDPNNKKLGERIAAHPRFDMGANAQGGRVPGLIYDAVADKILGYSVSAAIPETAWVDEKNAALQAAFDKALPNRINNFRRTPDGKRILVSSYSDRIPQEWYMYDEEKRSLSEVGSSQPWLKGRLTEQRPFTYKTRDGLEITGYYFLPKDHKSGTKLPTIVHIHGGPMVRADYWGGGFGFIEGQLFASHGYAVIVPNFRITPGLGSKIYYSGLGSYGRQMSDDHEDALKWGVEQGFVDPANVCMSGASYGGYAPLQALVRNDKPWKCVVAGLAVTDLKYQLTSLEGDIPANDSAVTYWKRVLGVNSFDDPIVREISPLFHADKIKKPVFLYAGEDDIRVPIRQINRMADALKAAGNPPKAYVVKEKEGHGFGKLENNVDLYNQILAFLKEQFGK